MSQDIILPPIVLTLAGADPTSGAGIQADILTLASMGCHPLSVITAITVQDTRGVQDFMVIDDEWVLDQARAVLEDMPVAAIKVGAVGNSDHAQAIAEILSDYPGLPVVFGRDDVAYVKCSDEHGEVSDPQGVLRVNDKLRLVPGHCDPTCNLHDWYVGVRGGLVEVVWPITARGKAF